MTLKSVYVHLNFKILCTVSSFRNDLFVFLCFYLLRHLFFQDAKLSLQQGKVPATPKEAARLVALVLQAEFGDFNPGLDYPSFNSLLPEQFNSDDLKTSIGANYERLRGMKQSFAEYRFLQEVYDIEEYGTDTFLAFQNNQTKCQREPNVEILIGSQVIIVKDQATSEVQRYIPILRFSTFH